MSSSRPDQGLGAGFEPVTDEQWREAVRENGNPDATFSTEVEEGISTQWLYVPADAPAPDPGGLPGYAPFVRGTRAGEPWQIRQEAVGPDRARANGQILEDLERGSDAIMVRLDRAARAAREPGGEAFAEECGADGVALSTLGDLAEVLDGVQLDLAPVALDAGSAAPPAAALLVALWRERGIAPEQAAGSLRLDPLGALAAEGELRRPPEEELALAAAVAAEVDSAFPAAEAATGGKPPAAGAVPSAGRSLTGAQAPRVRALAVDTGAYVEAGASAAWELAIAGATGVEYLRACARAGLGPAAAAARTEFTLAAGPDQFLEIAKFRAARRIWARILEACEVPAAQRHSPTFARTSERMITALDPWNNMLRGTTATFAAGVGGADGVTVTPFDREYARQATAGQESGQAAAPGKLGRRIARNTSIALQEESGLGRLADPAAGSWYVESLTDQLAGEAWSRFQGIEREGGALAALRSGRVASELAELAGARHAELSHRMRLMTGVNSYPLLRDERVEAEPVDREALARLEQARLAELPAVEPSSLDELRNAAGAAAEAGSSTGRGLLTIGADLAEAGARIDQIAAALAGDPHRQPALRPARDAIAFERLRSAAATHEATGGDRPRILLTCLGPIARHVNAANWARSFFESAGIEALNSVTVAADGNGAELDGGSEDAAAAVAAAADSGDPMAAVLDPAEAGSLVERSGTRIAAICAGRDEEVEAIREAAASLRRGGARHIYLAAPTAEQEQGAGEQVDQTVRDGVDMIAVLGEALERLGVEAESPHSGDTGERPEAEVRG